MDKELDLSTDEGIEFVLAVEETIEDIKNGNIDGTYSEF